MCFFQRKARKSFWIRYHMVAPVTQPRRYNLQSAPDQIKRLSKLTLTDAENVDGWMSLRLSKILLLLLLFLLRSRPSSKKRSLMKRRTFQGPKIPELKHHENFAFRVLPIGLPQNRYLFRKEGWEAFLRFYRHFALELITKIQEWFECKIFVRNWLLSSKFLV